MPIKRAILAALSILAVAAAAATAAAEEPLVIEQAVRLAVEGNLGLYRASLDLGATLRAAESARNLLYPSATLGAALSRSSAVDLAEGSRWSAGASLSLSLSLSPSLRRRAALLALAYESGLLGYEASRRELERQVRAAFYSILLSKAQLDLSVQNRERARASLELVTAKHGAGLAPELDLLSAQASLAAAEASLAASGAAYEDLLAEFRLLLGLDPGAPLALAGSLDQAKAVTQAAAGAAAAAPAEGPDVAALRRKLEAARVSRELAQAAILEPSVTLSAKAAPTFSAWNAGGKLSDAGSVSLGLSLPLDGLLPGSAERVALADAEDDIASLESQIEEARREAAGQAASLTRGIGAAGAALASLEKAAALAQRKYELYDDAYKRGYRDLSSLEDAAASLASARINVLSQEYSILTKALQLEAALGLEFGSIGR